VVRLLSLAADAAPDAAGEEVATATTDAEGRARFEGLEPLSGRRYVAESAIAEGGEPTRSKPFELTDSAQAIVLANAAVDMGALTGRGSPGAAPSPEASGSTAAPARRPMPPARRDPSVSPGTVRVIVVDGDDQPVTEQPVTVVRIDATRNREPTRGETKGQGFADVEVEARDDSFYFVQVDHDDAPFRSGFFEMPRDSGVTVAVRVFPRTDDRGRLKSAVHFEIDQLENDKARVLQVYEIAVEGDAAYWPVGGMRLWAADGGHGVKPLPDSARWLEEVEDAPFATLGRPLEPGGVLELSYAYIMEHDGDVEIEWDAPFPLIGARTAVKAKQSLVSGGAGEPKVVPHDESVTLVPVSRAAWRPSVCEQMRSVEPELECPSPLVLGGGEHVSFSLGGLIRRPRQYWIIGGVVFGFIALIAGIALLTAPSRRSVDVLRRRRDALIAALESAGDDPGRRRALIRALDRVVRQLEAVG
jgi:hypothetical protein